VEKIPLYKALPRIKFPKKSITKQVDKIINSNITDDFIPDIIIGHFHNPNLELVNLLKNVYSAKTCIILHGSTTNIKNIYKDDFPQLIDNIDIWGYRSSAIGKKFETLYSVRPQSFICYSGIPENFLTDTNEKKFSVEIKRIIYVGALIKRKNPTSLIYALDKVYPNKNFSLTFIGQGSEKKRMKKIIRELKLISNIHFLGHISREEVSKEIEASESFIMISENETFGLVYLEAMANEGIDGVIKDGENGFLCEAGNVIELTNIIRKINSLSITEKNIISSKAIEAAANLTDFKAAKKYLDAVLSF